MQKKTVVKKPNNTITISNGEITTTQRKAYNVLLYKALHDLKADKTKTEFLIPISEIEKNAGIQQTNNKRLKENLRKLMDIKVECIEGSAIEDWIVFCLLSQVGKEGNFLKYELPGMIRESLIKNDYYTALDLMIIKTLRGKYSVILYEIAMRYNKVEIPRYTIDEFKKITGTEKYKNFKDLRKWAIEPAIEEINEKTDIEMSYETFKLGRKVTEIKFRISLKTHINIPDESPESLLVLVPVNITDPIRKLIEKYHSSHGHDYVKRNLEYTNSRIRDKRKYRAYLGKSLANDYALDWIEDKAAAEAEEKVRIKTETEKQKKDTEKRVNKKDAKRLDLHDQLKEELKNMPAERIEGLRAGCLKDAAPFVRARLEKMPVSKLVSNPSFLDYCVQVVVN